MKRINPNSGMVVSLADASYWAYETADAIKQRINSDLYNPGAVVGLTVFASGTTPGAAAFTPGLAYDENGERIEVDTLQDSINYNGVPFNAAAADYRVLLDYEAGNDGVYSIATDGTSYFKHLTDSYSFRVAKFGTDPINSQDVVLSRILTTVVGGTLIFDYGIRNTFSAKFRITQVASDMSSVNGVFTGYINAGSNINSNGDIYTLTPGLGLVLLSPDGTKQCRLMLGNDGYLAQQPLNYVLS
jgi:hypothetical protein